ncbi:hypothetical protein EI94DRAFT_1814425 [Lactarius quietus]|nr:hypothetical protein EI94DRAFT_1814425 [Lactarius quietus]
MQSLDANSPSKILNPSICFSWIQHKWNPIYTERSKKIMLDLMLKYHEESLSLVQLAQTQACPKLPFANLMGKVEEEFAKYILGPFMSENMNILIYWEAHKSEFHTLFAIAMDYLLIQVPALMEALQMLKFLLKKKHLDFMASWETSEAAMLGETRLKVDSQLGIMLDLLLGGDIKKVRDELLHDDMKNYDG